MAHTKTPTESQNPVGARTIYGYNDIGWPEVPLTRELLKNQQDSFASFTLGVSCP
jgi:hypothetical protein